MKSPTVSNSLKTVPNRSSVKQIDSANIALGIAADITSNSLSNVSLDSNNTICELENVDKELSNQNNLTNKKRTKRGKRKQSNLTI